MLFLFFSDSVGVKWTDLKPRLNSNYDWDAAVARSMDANILLEEAIADGSIFVSQYPVFDNLITLPDITEPRPTRKMWPAMSPIALFASRLGKSGAPAQLRPVAIQLDFKTGKFSCPVSRIGRDAMQQLLNELVTAVTHGRTTAGRNERGKQ